MVQAALLAALPAAASMAGGAANALGNQGRRTFERPPMPSVALAMASSEDPKKAKALAKAAREDRLIYLLSQPEVVGLIILILGIYLSQNIPFSDDELTNESMQAISTTGSVLISLGYAGVGDLTTLLVAGMAGGVSLFDLIDLPDMPDIDLYGFLRDINPANLLANLWGAIT